MRRPAPITCTILAMCVAVSSGMASGAVAAPADPNVTRVAASGRLPTAPAIGQVVPRWRARARAAQRAAQARSGHVGWALLDHRGRLVAGWRVHQAFQSASIFKSMLLVCYLQDRSVRDRALTGAERSRLGAMVMRSDDPAANWAFGQVDRRCLYRLARDAGMHRFATSSHWGRTTITPYGTANLFFRIDRRVPERHRAIAMRWLRGVTATQRWGLPRMVPRSMAIAFKGGFALTTGGGHTISQGALVSAPNGHRVAVAVLTNHSPSARYGHGTIELIGRPLLRGYRPLPAVPGFRPRPR